MKNEAMACLQNAGARKEEFEKVLAAAREGSIPKDGKELLEKGRGLAPAKDSRQLFEYLPFRMVCETQYGKKEGYQEILKQFRQIKERDFDRMLQGTLAGETDECRNMAWFLAACVDTLEFTSMEIYEQYRYLADLIRASVHSLAEQSWEKGDLRGMDRETAGLFAASVLKACDLNVLLAEKYEKIGRALLAYSRNSSL